MDGLLTLTVATPQCQVLAEEAWSVTLPTSVGTLTLLPGHAEVIGQLVPGQLAVAATPSSQPQRFLLHEGSFVLDGGQLRVMAQLALPARQLQPQAARAELLAAQQACQQLESNAPEAQHQDAQRRLRRAEARLLVLDLAPRPPPAPPAPAPGA